MSKSRASSAFTTVSAPGASSAAKTTTQGWTSVFDMPLDELQKRTEQAATLMERSLELLPGLLTMTAKERVRSSGRLRAGEGAIYLDVIAVMEEYPAFFEGLADLDEGLDPTKVETALMRDRIQRAEVLAPLGGLLEKFGGIADTVLLLRGQVRQPLEEAYGIAKSLARTNATIRSKLARALDYYAKIAKAGAATRRANTTAKSSDGSGSSMPAAKS
jgi:hypothetical protein